MSLSSSEKETLLLTLDQAMNLLLPKQHKTSFEDRRDLELLRQKCRDSSVPTNNNNSNNMISFHINFCDFFLKCYMVCRHTELMPLFTTPEVIHFLIDSLLVPSATCLHVQKAVTVLKFLVDPQNSKRNVVSTLLSEQLFTVDTKATAILSKFQLHQDFTLYGYFADLVELVEEDKRRAAVNECCTSVAYFHEAELLLERAASRPDASECIVPVCRFCLVVCDSDNKNRGTMMLQIITSLCKVVSEFSPPSSTLSETTHNHCGIDIEFLLVSLWTFHVAFTQQSANTNNNKLLSTCMEPYFNAAVVNGFNLCRSFRSLCVLWCLADWGLRHQCLQPTDDLACAAARALGFKPITNEIVGAEIALQMCRLITNLCRPFEIRNDNVLHAIAHGLRNKNSDTSEAPLMMALVPFLTNVSARKTLLNFLEKAPTAAEAFCSISALTCMFRFYELFSCEAGACMFLELSLEIVFIMLHSDIRSKVLDSLSTAEVAHSLKSMITFSVSRFCSPSDRPRLEDLLVRLCNKVLTAYTRPAHPSLAAPSAEASDRFIISYCTKFFLRTLDDATKPMMTSEDDATHALYSQTVHPLLQTLWNLHKQQWLLELRERYSFNSTSSPPEKNSSSPFTLTREDCMELVYERGLTEEQFLSGEHDRLRTDSFYENCQDPQRCRRAMTELARRHLPTEEYQKQMAFLEKHFEKKFIFSNDQICVIAHKNSNSSDAKMYDCDILEPRPKLRFCAAKLYSTANDKGFLEEALSLQLAQAPFLSNSCAPDPNLLGLVGVSVLNEELPSTMRFVLLNEKPRMSLEHLLLSPKRDRPNNNDDDDNEEEEVHVRLPMNGILDVASQIASGLTALHRRRMIHGTLTLSNCLLFDRGNDEYCVKLSEFGCLTEAGLRAVSPADFSMKVKADVFAFGVLLYQLLIGGNCNVEVQKFDDLEAAVKEKRLAVKCGEVDLGDETEYETREIIRLCKECVNVDPSMRPKDGSALLWRMNMIRAPYLQSASPHQPLPLRMLEKYVKSQVSETEQAQLREKCAKYGCGRQRSSQSLQPRIINQQQQQPQCHSRLDDVIK